MGEQPFDEAPQTQPAPDRAKTLRGSPAFPSDPPAIVPARMINEVLYCERLLYLEWAQGEFRDNFFTVEGRSVHVRADRAKALRPPRKTPATPPAKKRARQGQAETAEEADETEPDDPPYQARSVWLTSERLGITAKVDVVDVDGGKVVPVEYKRGKQPDVPGGAYLPELAQVCAQVLLLRDHGYTCEEGHIYYAGDRRRIPIAITESLISCTRDAARRAREITAGGRIPDPLEDSPKCWGCSLAGICLPDEVMLAKGLSGEPRVDPEEPPYAPDVHGELEADPWGLDSREADDAKSAPSNDKTDTKPKTKRVRRLLPALDERVPLYVQEQGASIGLSGYRLVVRSREAGQEVRLMNTSQVSLFGNVQISTQALRALLDRGIPITYFSWGGWLTGQTLGTDTNNIELRMAQHLAARDDRTCLSLARGFVKSKILNCRTLLRRNHTKPDPTGLFELKQLARKAGEATSLQSLLGIEGTAARTYFGAFTGMLKSDAATGAFDLDGRNRRPPRDPINALLSFCYALLTKDLVIAARIVGLEPLLGFYHQPRFGRPALALDLMEEFRPLIADSVVLSALNNDVVTDRDFDRSHAGVALTAAGRKRLLMTYERRMDHEITHPLFGYRISYRRVLEVQARLLGRMLMGEIDHYPCFRTR